jgi:Flp pilus assembly protein TadD
MRAAAAWAAVLLAVLPAMALAQTYSAPTEAPRTTDRKTLGMLVREREIHERFVRGIAAEARAAWSDAVTEFTRVIALDPPEPRGSTARYDLAIAKARLGDYVAARILLTDALARDPGFTAAAANLVTVNVMAGDLREARSSADRFIALAPSSARARYSRGLVALRTGDLATARTDFRVLIADLELTRALALAPGYARARFALGTVFVRAGRNVEARAAFDRVAADASDITLRTIAGTLRDRL